VKLIPVYQAAGRAYGIPWTVLAAIHHQETDYGMGYVMNPSGTEGPMQFLPATFRSYGVTAPGQHGLPDINNVYDAIYTCAHMLAENRYRENPMAALYAYNHSLSYVRAVEQTAQSL